MANSHTSSIYVKTPNLSVEIECVAFAYRDLGPRNGVPVILLNHWGAVLDNFDPHIVDRIASEHRVIAIDYKGIGLSSGFAPLTVDEMARDVIAFISALGFGKINLFGFSLGGFVAQDIALKKPDLVHKLILAGTGPAGGIGIDKVGLVSWPLILKSMITLQDPQFYLFFPPTPDARLAAKEFLRRLKERKDDRDKGATKRAFLRQLRAIIAWGAQEPQDLGRLNVPVLIANGDVDLMVPTENSRDMARRIDGAKLVIYKNAGHGGIFQYYVDFEEKVLSFLCSN